MECIKGPGPRTLSDKTELTITNHVVTGFKLFFDDERAFCGACFKPRKMLDDDLGDILSRSDFCQCLRRGHA